MTRTPSHPLRGVLLCASLALSACGHSAPTRLFALEPATSAVPRAAYAGPPVRVETVQIPPALDRLEMVREVVPGEFRADDFARWAAPLGRIARQALTQDLASRLPAGRVLFPDAPKGADALGLSVDILAFRLAGPTARMTVSWSRGCPGGRGSRSTSQAMLEGPAGIDDASGTAAALGRLLGQLADRIVAELPRGPDPACLDPNAFSAHPGGGRGPETKP